MQVCLGFRNRHLGCLGFIDVAEQRFGVGLSKQNQVRLFKGIQRLSRAI